MSDLVPPKNNPGVIAGAKAFLPVFLRMEKLEVIPTANCVMNVRRLHGKQTVIMMNHSDRYDPVAAFALSKACRENFYYLAARELFDQKFNGWFMQNCGAYSVIRGSPDDVESKELTISLMVRGERKLIEFPEGDVTGRNDAIVPLKHDGLHNVLEAQQRLLEPGTDSPTLYVLPIAIFYQVQRDGIIALHKCLDTLEHKLGLSRIRGSVETRAFTLLDAVLDRLHEQYAIRRVPSPMVPDQITTLCRNLILKIARAHEVELETDKPEPVMLYDLRRELRTMPSAKPAIEDCTRIQRLLITASTLNQPITREIEWRLVDRLEEEITGKFTVKGNRIAWIESAPPIEVCQILAAYQSISDEAIATLDKTVRTLMLDALTSLREHRKDPLLSA